MRGASLSFLVRKGKQAEAFARPGPEGGRIVLRFAHPAEAQGGFDDLKNVSNDLKDWASRHL